MKIVLIFFLIFPNVNHAQESFFEGFIYSQNSNLPIEDATIRINAGDIIFTCVSDSKGKFKMKNIKVNDIIDLEISHISYIKRNWNNISQSKFYLVEKTTKLEEVLVSMKKEMKFYSLPFIDKQIVHTRNFSWNNEIAVFIPQEKKAKSQKIKKLLYAISDFEGVKGLKYQPFLANLYSVDTLTKLPQKPLIENSILVFKKNKKKWVEIDVSKYNLTIPPEGIFISMKILDENKYKVGFIQSKIGIISAVPAIKAYLYNNKYIRKSYIKGRYALLEDKSNIWVEEDCHYLMDIEF